MAREEKIKKYADKLAQQYFPDENNIWARENIEAKFVSEACMRMAKYIEQELIKKACELLEDCAIVDIEEFRRAMEKINNE